MFVRKKKNKSGSVSVQIIDTSSGKPRLLKTIGSSANAVEIENLYHQGISELPNFTRQDHFDFDWEDDRSFLDNLRYSLKEIQVIGPEIILGKLFDEIGFNQIPDELFRHLVISRLVFPLSKLKTSEYLMRYNGIYVDVEKIYRFLDKLNKSYKNKVQQISYDHTKAILNNDISLVFYDVTTLYFEAADEDDLRKTGFSKDGKHQNPQIVLGLLVSVDGYPLAYDIFEGNKFEGHTMLPIIEAFKRKYDFDKLLVVADAGLLSKQNIQLLLEGSYEFILGARIKSESLIIKKQIMSHVFSDGQSIVIDRADHTRLIVSYARSRAVKDAYNRQKGLNKLEKAISSGKMTKQHINNRGYNKYLKLSGDVTISIDYDKYTQDSQWDGLKGYISNSPLQKDTIIDNYKHLWQIEKAFRISKTDLRVRPIYHRLQRRIEAHLSIAFCSYKLYKELERQLKEKKVGISVEKAIDLMKTIYSINIILPKSRKKTHFIFAKEEQQLHLLKFFNINVNSQ